MGVKRSRGGGHIYFFLSNLFFAALSLALVSVLFLNYDPVIGIVQLGVGFTTCYLDGLSLSLIFLSGIIYLLSIIFTNGSVRFGTRFHLDILLSIFVLLVLSFATNNLLLFYIFFEALLIPMYLLIVMWGSRGRKFHAAYLFFFFTLASSIFIIPAITLIYYEQGSFCFLDFSPIHGGVVVPILLFFGFMSKIPVYPLHIWLPEAHVEAPTTGSVILAAILLKLGFYGLYRTILMVCVPEILATISPLFITFLLVSMVFSGLAALRQVDLKKVIAYSSIVHMNFALLGLFGSAAVGLVGSFFLMISHGLISGGMFLSVGILYDRFHTRNLMYYGGLVQFMPLFAIFFTFIMIANMSFPGTCNFVGELLVYLGVYQNNGWVILLLSLLGVLITSLFCLLVIVKVLFYQVTGFLTAPLVDIKEGEFTILGVLSFFILFWGVAPNTIIVLFGY